MTRNHYGGVRGSATVNPQKTKDVVNEDITVLKQNQQLLIDSIKMRDRVIEELVEKLSNNLSEVLSGVVDNINQKIDEKLSSITVNVNKDKKIDYYSSEDEAIFINPMDSEVGLEKSFEELGKKTAVESGASEKRSKLKDLLKNK